MNKVIISGIICNELELRYTSNEKEYCQFNIAVARDKEHTDFVKVATFGGTAKLISEYCKKGDRVLIDGSISTSQYEKDGHKMHDVSINANRIEFLEMRKEETKEIKKFNNKIDSPKDIEITDEDLPF